MKSIRLSRNGYKIGSSQLGTYGDQTGSVRQIVSDGDTIKVRLEDNLGVRLLGIDSAELSAMLPGTDKWVHMKNDKWDQFFTSGDWQTGLDLHSGLMLDLEVRIGTGQDVAANQARHAEYSHRTLERIIQEDMDKAKGKADDFVFFMAFGHEFMDSTGRMLCYLNSDRDNFKNKKLRDTIAKLSYNERQLATGTAYPYFIWPNIQPFISNRPFLPESVAPEGFWKTIQTSYKLKKARASIQAARQSGLGVYDPQDKLRLAPFELRYITRRMPPSRFVIDLSRPGSKNLLSPELYYTIPNPEDRLFIPAEYRLIFEGVGWIVAETENSEAVG